MVRYRVGVQKDRCVACGCCVKVCPRSAISIYRGLFAEIDEKLCIGCMKCKKECPASVIVEVEVGNEK